MPGGNENEAGPNLAPQVNQSQGHFKMPMFDPNQTTFSQYITDVYEVKAWGFNWNSNTKLRHLALILPQGWCSRAFCQIGDDYKTSYALLKDQLIKEFDRSSEKKQTAAGEFHKMTQNSTETVDEFAHRLRNKVEEAYPTFARANKAELCGQRFFEGIRGDKIKEQLNIIVCQTAKMPSFDSLVDTARRLAQISKPEEHVFRVRCFFCHKVGHTEKQCFKKKNSNKSQDQKSGDSSRAKNADWVKSAKCYNCSKRGHIARDCSEKRKGGKINEVESGDSPTRSIVIGQLECSAIVDSGASVSCISTASLTKAFPRGVVIDESTRPLRAAASLKIPLIGTFTTPICMDGDIFDCKFYVLDDDTEESVLLGWDFLCRFDEITLRPKENVVVFTADKSTDVATVRLVETTTIPPRAQRICRVTVDRSCTSKVTDMFIERSDDFEYKTGLLVGRCVTSVDDAVVVLLNPDTTSKKVYRCQSVGTCSGVQVSHDQAANVRLTDTQGSWNIGNVDDQYKSELVDMLDSYEHSVFTGLGKAEKYEYKLRLKQGADLSSGRHYRRRYGPHLEKVVDDQVQSLLKSDIVEPSTSEVISPIVLVKKPDKTIRFCLDFRFINQHLVDEIFPLATVSEALMRLNNSKYFSVLDMNSAYNQIPLEESSRYLTAFETSSGVYQFKRMCFGLKTAPLAFQRLMQTVLCGLTLSYVLVYLDDVLIHSASPDLHLQNLREVLERFKAAGMTLRRDKCHFFRENVDYLGFKISQDGVHPGDKGLRAIREYPIPQTWEQVRSFLGLCTFFQRFIPNFSDNALPLSRLVEGKMYTWNLEHERCFDRLRKSITAAPLLSHPDFDDNASPFIVQTDASGTGLAGVLLQDSDGYEHPISYASKKLSKTERNYSTIHREALAIIWAVRKFREYIYGRKFVIRTDHKPLVFIASSKTSKCARWSLELSEYDYTVEYVKGSDNVPSDVLSRAPVEDETDLPILAVTRNQSTMLAHQEVIERAHALAHFGPDRTLQLAKEINPSITLREVQTHIAGCRQCVEGPHAVPKSTLGITRTALSPWEIVHCDFVGPLPRTSAGYEYIFTFKDDLTRYILAVPLRTATTVTAKTVLNHIFSIFGPPTCLHMDNGSVFTSAEFRSFLSSWNVECRYSPVYRPQANPVERAHRTLKASLVKTADTEKDWDLVLPAIVAAHNAVTNRTTGIPPFYAMFGRSSPIINVLSADCADRVVGEEECSMREIWDRCRETQINAKEVARDKSDKGVQRNFNVGQPVAVKVLSGPKFKKQHFATGFVVVKVLGDFLVVCNKQRKHRDTVVISKDLVILDTCTSTKGEGM